MASVAQVHRAHLQDGTEVAMKVLRPGIRRQVKRCQAKATVPNAMTSSRMTRMVTVHIRG